jgi:hypothetical protein
MRKLVIFWDAGRLLETTTATTVAAAAAYATDTATNNWII